MFCNKCGTENEDETKFCSSCGNGIEGVQKKGDGENKTEESVQEEPIEKKTSLGRKIWLGFCYSFGSLLAVGFIASQFDDYGPEDQAEYILREQMKDPYSFSSTGTKIMWQGKDKKNRNAYVIKVEYRAKNSFGAILPDCKMVAFSLDDGKYFFTNRLAFDTCGVEGDPLFDPKRVAEVMSSQFES